MQWAYAISRTGSVIISNAEARAAFAGHRRDRKLTPAMLLSVKRDLDADWSRCAIVEPTVALCRAAGARLHRDQAVAVQQRVIFSSA